MLYPTQMTPSGWTIYIWGAIYAYTFLWLVYVSTIFCRKEWNGRLLFVEVPFVPLALYYTFFITNAANISWLFAWDHQQMIASACLSAVMWISLCICIGIVCYGVKKYYSQMIKSHLSSDVWCDRVLVQNGLGLYAGWSTVTTLIYLSMVLTYETDVGDEDGTTISLSLLAGLHLTYFLVDTIASDRYTRYLITPYMVIPYTLAGILDNNWDPEARNWMLTMAMFGLACALFVGKLIVMGWNFCVVPDSKLYNSINGTSGDFSKHSYNGTYDDKAAVMEEIGF